MLGAWNPIRLAGDLSHLIAKCVLIWAIHRNKSAEGVSLLTQVLYAIVFCTRYLDLFSAKSLSLWNFVFKIFYITSSFYTIFIMSRVYARSRERELAFKISAVALGGSLLISPFVMWIFQASSGFRVWLWVFSQILESVCVLPQLLLLRQTTVPTVIDSFYLVALGSYRGLYLINWFVRGLEMHGSPPDSVSVIFGVIQTALYIDFAWVYYTRQRVKLRDGGVVDADDIRRGWILGRIFGRRGGVEADDEENQPSLGNSSSSNNAGGGQSRASRAKWGARGISVSADDGVIAGEQSRARQQAELDGADPDARMRDPDELARVLEEEEDDDDDDEDDDEEEDSDDDEQENTPLASGSGSRAGGNSAAAPGGIKSGQEWRD